MWEGWPVRIHSDRRYEFAASREELWSAFAQVDQYRLWWPWLSDFEGEAIEPGQTWRCTVRPQLPYKVSFRVTILDVTPAQWVSAGIDGDIVGNAELNLLSRPAGCVARLESHLAPGSLLLQSMALLAQPVVTMGHNWVLDSGARQFREHCDLVSRPSIK